MDASEIRTALAAIFERVAGVDGARVTADAKLTADLGLDSLAVAEITTAAEERFGVKIPDSRIESFVTVEDLVRFIQARLA